MLYFTLIVLNLSNFHVLLFRFLQFPALHFYALHFRLLLFHVLQFHVLQFYVPSPLHLYENSVKIQAETLITDQITDSQEPHCNPLLSID